MAVPLVDDIDRFITLTTFPPESLPNPAEEVKYCTVLISVIDNGVGISEEDIAGSLFQEFRQLKAGLLSKQSGSGLGLAICREIVTLHHGRIGVRSTVGQGSEFIIALRLPIVQPSLKRNMDLQSPDDLDESTKRVLQESMHPRALRILVVDDAPSNRKLLIRTMSKRLHSLRVIEGDKEFRVKVEIDDAEDGHVAVGKVTGEGPTVDQSSVQRAACLNRYDCITIDAQMPVLSGYDATVQLRALGYKGLVYGCTGNALQSDIQLFIDSGADDVFTKPIDIPKLATSMLESLKTNWDVEGFSY